MKRRSRQRLRLCGIWLKLKFPAGAFSCQAFAQPLRSSFICHIFFSNKSPLLPPAAPAAQNTAIEESVPAAIISIAPINKGLVIIIAEQAVLFKEVLPLFYPLLPLLPKP